MQLSNIKTQTDFYKFSDIWYQRCHKLREVWQNENNNPKTRMKAYRLWLVMYTRVIKLSNIAKELNTVKTRL